MYRQLYIRHEGESPSATGLRQMLSALTFEPHPRCWDKGANRSATAEYAAALLMLAKIMHELTGITIDSNRLIVQQVTRCRAMQKFYVIVYEPIRRVLTNGSMQRHVYKYEVEFKA